MLSRVFSLLLCLLIIVCAGLLCTEAPCSTATGDPRTGINSGNGPPKINLVARDPERDSVETYKELTKLLISLGTGALVLLVTVLGFLRRDVFVAWWCLIAGSISLVVSIFCGIVVLSTLAGSQHANDYNIDYWLTRLFAIPEWILFAAGLVLVMLFVFKNLKFESVHLRGFSEILDLLVRKGTISADDRAEVVDRIRRARF